MYSINSYCSDDDRDRPDDQSKEEHPQPQIVPYEIPSEERKEMPFISPGDLEKIIKRTTERIRKKEQNKPRGNN